MKTFDELISNTEQKQLNGYEIINRLSEMHEEKEVYFCDHVEPFHGAHDLPVNDFFSWRGSYSEPSIWSDGNETHTVKALIIHLKDFFSSIQTGWKGGEFQMDCHSPVWCDPEGACRERGVKDVVECEEAVYIVVGQFKY